jgi:hypothetical protein
MNRRNTLRFLLWTGALMLASTMVPSAMAQCGLPTKPVKPAVWHPRYGGAHQTLVRAAVDDDDEQEPSIVGMWHVIFTAQTMNGEPFSGVIDNSIVVWHSDGTEIMNSSRPAQDGNFCLGVWTRAGKLKYHVNHIPWQGNDPSNAPGGIGNPQGGAQLIEKVTLSTDGNSYVGTFTLDAYDTTGHVTVSFVGVLTAKRITPHTPFTDLL